MQRRRFLQTAGAALSAVPTLRHLPDTPEPVEPTRAGHTALHAPIIDELPSHFIGSSDTLPQLPGGALPGNWYLLLGHHALPDGVYFCTGPQWLHVENL